MAALLHLMVVVWFILAAMGATIVRAILRTANARVPWGTMVVNLGGSLVLGLCVGSGSATTALAVGGLGALTTWSMFLSEVLDRRADRALAVGYFTTSLVGGVALAYLGLRIAP